jgi:hypothetical protein
MKPRKSHNRQTIYNLTGHEENLVDCLVDFLDFKANTCLAKSGNSTPSTIMRAKGSMRIDPLCLLDLAV